jgi:hypothetical protein
MIGPEIEPQTSCTPYYHELLDNQTVHDCPNTSTVHLLTSERAHHEGCESEAVACVDVCAVVDEQARDGRLLLVDGHVQRRDVLSHVRRRRLAPVHEHALHPLHDRLLGVLGQGTSGC